MIDLSKLLTSKQAALRMGRTDRWLRELRRMRKGPPWIRYRDWQALYDPADVDSWVSKNLKPNRGPRK